MLYWMCEKSGYPPTWPQLEHAIRRNFGGLESKELNPIKIFKDKLPGRRDPPDLSSIPEEVSSYYCIVEAFSYSTCKLCAMLRFHFFNLQLHSIISPDCSNFGLIQASLSSKERTWHGYICVAIDLWMMIRI